MRLDCDQYHHGDSCHHWYYFSSFSRKEENGAPPHLHRQLCGVKHVHDCVWVHKVWAYAEASKGQKVFAVRHLCLFLLRQSL